MAVRAPTPSAPTFDPDRSRGLLQETLGFRPVSGASFEARGVQRGGFYVYDEAPGRGIQGAGTVHHIAWAVADDDEQLEIRERAIAAGARPTPVIDRTYFHSVYFREPSGVLFELATLGPGFAVDEPADRLGEELRLPPQHEQLRERLERTLTPLVNPRHAAGVE